VQEGRFCIRLEPKPGSGQWVFRHVVFVRIRLDWIAIHLQPRPHNRFVRLVDTSPRLVGRNFRNRNPADGCTAASFWLIRSAHFTARNFTGATLSLTILHRRAVCFQPIRKTFDEWPFLTSHNRRVATGRSIIDSPSSFVTQNANRGLRLRGSRNQVQSGMLI